MRSNNAIDSNACAYVLGQTQLFSEYTSMQAQQNVWAQVSVTGRTVTFPHRAQFKLRCRSCNDFRIPAESLLLRLLLLLSWEAKKAADAVCCRCSWAIVA